MRKKHEKQMQLTAPIIDHPKAIELETISQILDQNHTIIDLVYQDLSNGSNPDQGGASGMTAEQVFRAALLKQMHGYTYRDLAFHLEDSASIRSFMRIGFSGRTFKHSALQDNISKISSSTWEAINRVLLDWAKCKKNR